MSKKEEWLAFEWPGYHIYQAIAPMKAWAHDFAPYCKGLSRLAATYERGTTSFYAIRREYEDSGREFFERVRRDPAVILSILNQVDKVADKIFALGRHWDRDDCSILTNRELLGRHRALFNFDEALWRKGQIQNLLELHNNYLTVYIRSVIRSAYGEAAEPEIFKILTTPTYRSLSDRQDDDFIKILPFLSGVKPSEPRFRNLIERHWRKYRWMIYGWAGPAIDLEYFTVSILAARRNKLLSKRLAAKQMKRKQLLRQQRTLLNKLAPHARKLAVLLRALVDAKAKRVDAHSCTYFYGDQVRSEIAKRLGISRNQMRVVPPHDTPGLFKRIDVDALNREYEYTLYWFKSVAGFTKLVGNAARKKFQYIKARLPKVKMTDQLEGELAYAGKVRGKVRVILSVQEAAQFKKGEILVTRMTDPNYLPIMKKSAAIVTDIGGITCHAAIVSRELKIPCVVGTKIATKVFKDGDLVEVDAERGVVRKLK